MIVKRYNVILTSVFLDDLDKIITFYKEKNSTYADKLFCRIKELLTSLETYPERFAIIPDILPIKNLI